MNLPPDNYATIEGHRLRYWDTGQGQPLLLLHGLANSSLVWHKVLPALAQRHRVLSLDLPGHGLSDMPQRRYTLTQAAQFVDAFMQSCNASRYHIAGNSMGGGIALEAGLRYPDRVASVTLVGSVGLGRGIAGFLRVGSLPFVGDRFQRPTIVRIRRLIRAVTYDPSTVPEDMVQEMLRYRQRPGAYAAMLLLLRTGVTLFGQKSSVMRLRQLPALRPPLLLLWGAQDRIVPVAHAQAAKARLPSATLRIFDRCGHWPQIEHAGDFAAGMLGFLGATGAPSSP